MYRQSQIAARDGVKLDPASMGRWVGRCEALCDALTEALRRYTVAPSKLHADADAYSGFNELYESGKIREAACWDHARRYIYDVHARTPTEATREVLELIGGLYAIEAEIRGKPAAQRLRVRQEKSIPLLAAIKTWMTDKLAALSKKSELAKAIRYSLNRWDALVLYCEEGRAEISNALAENALRGVSLGRKNFLFAGSDSGGGANGLRRCIA